MRNLFFIVCGILFFPVSCISINPEKLVYSLTGYEINREELSFSVKNTGTFAFSDFIIYVEFYNTGSSNDDSEIIILQKKINCSLESGLTDDFTINLLQDSDLFEMTQSESDATFDENSISIQKIYIKEINFENGTKFSDCYGSWSF
ncbi:MAG: hypothetical protein KBT21_02660 [Treponema sp.]|nr:hypothetical protein [Candidatus Treponema merdequi]